MQSNFSSSCLSTMHQYDLETHFWVDCFITFALKNAYWHLLLEVYFGSSLKFLTRLFSCAVTYQNFPDMLVRFFVLLRSVILWRGWDFPENIWRWFEHGPSSCHHLITHEVGNTKTWTGHCDDDNHLTNPSFHFLHKIHVAVKKSHRTQFNKLGSKH